MRATGLSKLVKLTALNLGIGFTVHALGAAELILPVQGAIPSAECSLAVATGSHPYPMIRCLNSPALATFRWHALVPGDSSSLEYKLHLYWRAAGNPPPGGTVCFKVSTAVCNGDAATCDWATVQYGNQVTIIDVKVGLINLTQIASQITFAKFYSSDLAGNCSISCRNQLLVIRVQRNNLDAECPNNYQGPIEILGARLEYI